MARYILAPDGNLIVERRATPRYDVSIPIEIGLGPGREPVTGTTTDVSEAGVQVLTTAALPLGRVLEFRAPGFRGTFEVMWSREEEGGARSGFRFATLSVRDREALLDLIADRRRRLAREFAAARG